MTEDATITARHQPGFILDPLTAIAREAARQMLMAALKSEAARLVARFGEELLPDGRRGCVSDLVEILWPRSPSNWIWA